MKFLTISRQGVGTVSDLFNCYACHTQTIENFINKLAATVDPNDYPTQVSCASSVGLCLNSLTLSERNYIEKEVAKRWTPR